MISLIPSTSSPTAGESVSLTCSVTLPGTVSGSPVLQWAGPKDTLTLAVSSTGGQEVTSTLTLNAVRTSQAGQYACIVHVEGPNQTVSIAFRLVNITVQSKWTYFGSHCHSCIHVPHSPAVPAPIVVFIMTSRSPPLYAGTSFSLTCNFTLSPSVDTSPATAVSWRVNGTVVDTSPDRITASGDSLSFSPLATSDSGNYTCEVIVTAQEQTTVESPGQGAAVEVTVEGNERHLI